MIIQKADLFFMKRSGGSLMGFHALGSQNKEPMGLVVGEKMMWIIVVIIIGSFYVEKMMWVIVVIIIGSYYVEKPRRIIMVVISGSCYVEKMKWIIIVVISGSCYVEKMRWNIIMVIVLVIIVSHCVRKRIASSCVRKTNLTIIVDTWIIQ